MKEDNLFIITIEDNVKKVIRLVLVSLLLFTLLIALKGCRNDKQEKAALMQAIEDYENAWASGDFLTAEQFFAKDAKRLHTEPHVWDRAEIKRYFEDRAVQGRDASKPFVKNAWKQDREYLEIRVEGNIAYDIFTTDTFKAMHIWELQADGTWKIIYDVGFLHDTHETN